MDSDSDDELGAFIYAFSQTAKRFRAEEKKERRNQALGPPPPPPAEAEPRRTSTSTSPSSLPTNGERKSSASRIFVTRSISGKVEQNDGSSQSDGGRSSFPTMEAQSEHFEASQQRQRDLISPKIKDNMSRKRKRVDKRDRRGRKEDRTGRKR